jgi:hypothetical protein
MKETALRFSIALSVFAIMYLLTSFVEVTFDISKWQEVSRFVTALCGGGFGLAAFTFPYNFKDK